MSQKIAVVDYHLNNLDSVCRALEECGARPFVTDEPGELKTADRIVLPGVGAFPDAMRNLADADLVPTLRDEVLGGGVPFLGICLGMQLLASSGTEVEAADGLDLVPGVVRRLQPIHGERIPHMGWNEVVPVDPGCPLFDGIPAGADFYFVHSFHMVCADDADVAARTPYCGEFTSVVHHGSVFGVQFHPEKSQTHGFRLLQNFLAW